MDADIGTPAPEAVKKPRRDIREVYARMSYVLASGILRVLTSQVKFKWDGPIPQPVPVIAYQKTIFNAS
jgi:hypothetical protein